MPSRSSASQELVVEALSINGEVGLDLRAGRFLVGSSVLAGGSEIRPTTRHSAELKVLFPQQMAQDK